MNTAKVIGEVYRVAADKSEHASPAKAVAHAYKLLVNEIEAGGAWLRFTTVQRVTKHGPVDNGFFGVSEETVTGEIVVESPGQLAERPELSRYSPVNGWCAPETIEVGR